MAAIDEFVKGWAGTALLAVGATLAAPTLFPEGGAPLRPLAKRLLKGTFALVDRTREFLAEAGEHASDLVAEARYEYTQERGAGSGPAVSPAPSAPEGQQQTGTPRGRATVPLHPSPGVGRPGTDKGHGGRR
jgi:hypothetical protein